MSGGPLPASAGSSPPASDMSKPGGWPGFEYALERTSPPFPPVQVPLARQVLAVSPRLPASDRQYLPDRGGSMWTLYPSVRADQK